MMAFAILGLILMIVVCALRRCDIREDLCMGLTMPLVLALHTPLTAATVWMCPHTLDSQLRKLDLLLRLDGFAVTRWAIQDRFCWVVLLGVYISLPLAMAVAWSLERRRALFYHAVIGALMAFPVYLMFPAVGPKYFFADFPISGQFGQSAMPRDCVPSMHLTWALLIVINVRDWRWKWVFVLYAALMAVATVAVGEHYFVDVMAAVPFTILVQAVGVYAQRSGIRSEGVWQVTCAAMRRAYNNGHSS